MKKSINATEYLLIKAKTNSEWDNGDFAIIHITDDWKKTHQRRLEAVKIVENDFDLNFHCQNYWNKFNAKTQN